MSMNNITFYQYKFLIRDYFEDTYKMYPVPEKSKFCRINTFSIEHALNHIMYIVEDLFLNIDFSLYCFSNQHVAYRYIIVDSSQNDYGFNFGIELSISNTDGNVKKETFMLLNQMTFMRTVMDIFYNKGYRIAA